MTVGELRAVLADPMLEDRHEVLIAVTVPSGDGLNPEPDERGALGARAQMAGLRRALVIETDVLAAGAEWII